MLKPSFCFFLLAALLTACSSNDAPQIPYNKLPADHTKENLIKFDQQYMQLEDKEINHYVDSLHLKVQKTSEGIRYSIAKPGSSIKPKKGNKVSMVYTVSLFDGSSCEALTNKETTVEYGKGKLPIGMEKALSMLGVGGQGDFIIPAMLAYGVSGRDGCVPPYTPVRCTILLKNIE